MAAESLFVDISAIAISNFHDRFIEIHREIANPPVSFQSGIWHYIEANHRYNCLLWDEEDQARRRNVADAMIAANKRAIDGYNQQRQDAIEKIDELFLARLTAVKRRNDARQHSETMGSMVDRLSILSLKLYHMDVQRRRVEAGEAHVQSCAAKYRVLQEQREDLQQCLQTLMSDVARGIVFFKVYRQFKMYNDPALNPYLYEVDKATDR